MYFDTHVHFHETGGDRGIEALVTRAAAADVGRMVAVGGACDMNRYAVDAAGRFPEKVWAAVGFDRDQAENYASGRDGMDAAMDRLRLNVQALNRKRVTVVALGEMGLDYHYSADTADMQKALFRDQLAIAAELRLPVVVHSREADEDTLSLLAPFAEQARAGARAAGVLHCFTGGSVFAHALLEMGFFISFSGIVSFRNADALREVAKGVPEDRLLIETDTPYLAPVPHRGKRNEPAFVVDVAACLAQVRGSSVEAVARVTTENAERLFRIG